MVIYFVFALAANKVFSFMQNFENAILIENNFML